MRSWRLLVAYEGSQFCGWQRQPKGVAIQLLIEQALHRILGQPIVLYGASRTDAGVHALGQVAHFTQPETTRLFEAKELLKALNANLPPQIRVLKVARANAKFHAQFKAKGKQYRYRIFNGKILPPLLWGRVWQVPQVLETQAMTQAARYLIGRHDFLSFSINSKTERKTTVREITRLEIRKQGSCYEFIIEGNGFLYKMVRMIVGALVQTGLGKYPSDWIQERLKNRVRKPGILTAPAEGLYLVKVFY